MKEMQPSKSLEMRIATPGASMNHRLAHNAIAALHPPSVIASPPPPPPPLNDAVRWERLPLRPSNKGGHLLIVHWVALGVHGKQ
jgi:hypothetical protein